MKKTYKILLAILALVIVAVIIYFQMSKKAETNIIPLTTIVQRGDVSTEISSTGTVEPTNQVEVGTQVSGVVKKVYVDFNAKVKKGQLLAELDKTNLLASLNEAQANYSTAISQKNYLQSEFNRQKTLYENNLISKADYESSEYDLKSVNGTVAQRLSELNKAKTNLSYADIYSPIDGVVLSRDVDEGQTVAASLSTPTLFTIAQDLKEMQVEADVDEADIGSVKEGQRVTFTVDAFQGEEFSGKVTQVRLNPTTSSNVVTYTVVIKADNPEMKLMPGLTATISIFTSERVDVLTIDSKVLNFSPDENLVTQFNAKNSNTDTTKVSSPKEKSTDKNIQKVWVLEKNQLVPRIIKTGLDNGVKVEILEGLQEGDKVVYNLSATSADSSSDSSATTSESPFMPKPPGKKNK